MTAPTIKPGTIFPIISRAQIVDKNGNPTFVFTKALQDADTRITNSLNQFGQLLNGAQVAGLPANLGTLLQHLTATGELDSLLSVAAGVNLDNIADTAAYQRTTPNDVLGAAAAYAALLASAPTNGKVLRFNGALWLPSTDVQSVNGLTGTPSVTAGSGINVSVVGSNIQVSAAGGGAGYVKGTVTLAAEAAAGTYTATGAITGAVVGSGVLVSPNNSTQAALFSNLQGWVSSAGNVTIQVTSNAAFIGQSLIVTVFN